MPKKTHRCEGSIRGDYRSHRCLRNAKIERDGKWYCGTHDPVAKKTRQAAIDARLKPKRDAENERRRRRNAETAACEGIPTAALEAGAIRELVETAKIAIEPTLQSDFTAQRRAAKLSAFDRLGTALAKLEEGK